jgi:hypothetical protein
MKFFSNLNFKYIFIIILVTSILGYILGMTISTVVDYRLKDAIINLPKPTNKIYLKVKDKKIINLNKIKSKGNNLEIEIEKKNKKKIIDRSKNTKGKKKNNKNKNNKNKNKINILNNVESFDPKNDTYENSPWNLTNIPDQYKMENKIKPYYKTKNSLFGYNRKSSLGSFPDKLSSTYAQDTKGIDITTKTYSKLFSETQKKKIDDTIDKKISASNSEDIDQQFQSFSKKITVPITTGSEKIQRKLPNLKKKKKKRKKECKIYTK